MRYTHIGFVLLCGLLALPVVFGDVFSDPLAEVQRSDMSSSAFAVCHTPATVYGGAGRTLGVVGQGNGDDPIDSKMAIRECSSCHELNRDWTVSIDHNHFLNGRIGIDREKWAEDLQLSTKCGSCHTPVDPNDIPQRRWQDVMRHMKTVITARAWPMEYTAVDWLDILHYYMTGCVNFKDLPPDPAVSGLKFTTHSLGTPQKADGTSKIGNVNIVDLDQDDNPDILVTDFDFGTVSWITKADTGWRERELAHMSFPAKTEVFDFNGDGHLDIVVASLGSIWPTDNDVGSAYLLINDGEQKFSSKRIINRMGRLADIRPADFDNDGDYDFVIAAFGFLKIGEVGWLEQKDDGTFEYHRMSPKAGGIHVIPTDLNDDGFMDVVGLISQEHEEIIAFVNQGDGTFKQELIYKAFTPAFGSSGIELVDMDGDGDEDILYTNGDAVDFPQPMILPYHGVQWLERKEGLTYEYHSIFSFYGAYRAVPADMDDDGDMDIVAVTMVNEWEDASRLSTIWLENDGKQNFTPHGVGHNPINLVTLDVGDLDDDGDMDLVTGGLNLFNVIENRTGRVTFWRNDGVLKNGGK